MQILDLQRKWIRLCILFLSIYYIVSYVDPLLSQNLCNCGVWGNLWPTETLKYVIFDWSFLFTEINVSVLIAIGLFAALLLNFKRFLVTGVVLTFIIQSVIMLRDPYYYVIHKPFIGLVTVFLPFLVFTPEQKYAGIRPSEWLWFISGISYLASAVSKLKEPFWLAGSALSSIQGFPLRSDLFKELVSIGPLAAAATYVAILIELFYGLFCYFKKFQFAAWLSVILLHIGIMILLEIPSTSLPMILFHLFLFDVKYLKSGLKTYDS